MRPCRHREGPGTDAAHSDDHVDVFLDHFRMDHHIDLARRLQIEPYTISLSDLLLTKLQIFRLNEKDLRDIVTLLADVEVSDEDAPGTIDGSYIGRLCADDWGLFYDVVTNLHRADDRAASFDLSEAQEARRAPRGDAAHRRHRRRAEEPALASARPRRHARHLAQRTRSPRLTPTRNVYGLHEASKDGIPSPLGAPVHRARPLAEPMLPCVRSQGRSVTGQHLR